MKRVAAYIRVSTDEQVEKGNSLADQQERLFAYCKAMGWNEPSFYVDDGYSAKDLQRPAISKLLLEIKKRSFDIVLTSKLDRLSRNLLDLLNLVNMMEKYDCNYVSSSESFDTSTAAGRMVLQLLGVFAEFERERISERVKDNMISLAKNTKKAITRPCFGFDVVNGEYKVNEKEAHYVRIMCNYALEGDGHRMIAKKLNDLGATTKQGNMWDQINVKRLLQNETIAGIMIYNKRKRKNGKTVMRDKTEWIIKKDNHLGIITPEQFEQIQSIMKARSKAGKHADSETYLLTGIVKCKHCGKNMKGSTSRYKRKNKTYTYYRYICSSYVLGYGCSHHAVHRDDLEKAVLEEIQKIASASGKELQLKISTVSIEDEIKDLKAQLSKIDKRIQKQIEAYEMELITAQDLKLASERVKEERDYLLKKIERVKQNGNPDTNTVRKNINKYITEVTNVDRMVAKRAIRHLIDRIEIENVELISITWKV